MRDETSPITFMDCDYFT